jgi:hypothetical protein
MDWIDETVAIGNWYDGFSARRRRHEGIELIIDSRVLFTKSTFPSRRVPMVDGLVKARDQILVLLPFKPKVLIFCSRGRDRSAFLSMMYVRKRYGLDFQEAYELVRSKHRQAAFHRDWAAMLDRDGR